MLAVGEGGQVHCESEIMPIVGDEPIKACNLAISQNQISLSLSLHTCTHLRVRTHTHTQTHAHTSSSKHWLVSIKISSHFDRDKKNCLSEKMKWKHYFSSRRLLVLYLLNYTVFLKGPVCYFSQPLRQRWATFSTGGPQLVLKFDRGVNKYVWGIGRKHVVLASIKNEQKYSYTKICIFVAPFSILMKWLLKHWKHGGNRALLWRTRF